MIAKLNNNTSKSLYVSDKNLEYADGGLFGAFGSFLIFYFIIISFKKYFFRYTMCNILFNILF